MPSKLTNESVMIRDVWNHNLEGEFELIRDLIDSFPYVAMDTEFPGVVLRFVGKCNSVSDQCYENMRCNVDILNVIQIGMTFADGDGNLPQCGTGKHCIWQFNFREFNPRDDVYAEDSIDMLRRSGFDFAKNMRMGVDSKRFAELLMSSGVVMNQDVQWVTFHGTYDFGYLLRLLTCQSLPTNLVAFYAKLALFFPVIYDVKYMTRYCNNLHGGLSRIAEVLKVERVGVSHQAGSDSLLTFCTFLRFMGNRLDGSVAKDAGVIFSLEVRS